MTRQESFNHICRNLIAATRPSVYRDDTIEETRCQYRGEDGAKCAVGWLIPDDLYHPHMEGKSVLRLFADHPELRKEPTLKEWTSHLLCDLQQIHDGAAVEWHHGMDWGSIMRANLTKFATHNNLKMEV